MTSRNLSLVTEDFSHSNTIGVGTCEISNRAIQYVNDVLRSGRLSYGPYTEKFERLFAAAHDCRFGVMTNSGTSSLMIALHALKLHHRWNDGDEVLVPAVTFVATANIVLQLNLKPVFVDVDPIFYEMDPVQIEKALTSRTRCIIPVHLFGCPCDMENIMRIANANNLQVLEDSCEAMFTSYQGKSVGAFGSIGCFSTYVAHLLCTGVGGLCTTNSPELAITLRSLANHGRDSIYLSIDDDNNKSGDELKMIIQKRFSFVQLGYSFRVTEMEGALGLAELENHVPMMEKRRINGQGLTLALHDLEEHLQLPSVREGAGHGFMMFPIVLRSEKKNNLVNFLERQGVETRDMLPLVNQPVYQDLLNIREENFPVAKWINQNGFYIGCHQSMGPVEIDHISQTIRQYFKRQTVDKKKACLIVMSNIHGNHDPLILQNIIRSLRATAFDEYILADASDGGSVAGAFRENGFMVVAAKVGKGALLKMAIEKSSSEFIVVIGADGADNSSEVNTLLIRLRRGADIVVASRFMPGGGRDTDRPFSYRSVGNRFFTFVLSVVFGRNITDCNNLLRGFTREAFQKLSLKSERDSVMFEMTAEALRHGLRYEECPTVEKKGALSGRRANRLVMAVFFMGIVTRYLFKDLRGEARGR